MSHDTWLHRVSRAVIVRPLLPTFVTPNQLTALRLITGIVASLAVAGGGREQMMTGAGLFVISMLLDRADGDLARARGAATPRGHVFDLVSDAVCNALIFVGLGLGLRDGGVDDGVFVMGMIAGAGVALILSMVLRVENRDGARAAELRGHSGFDPDDAMLAVPVAIWLGVPKALLFAAAFGAPCFAVIFFFVFRKKLIGAAH